MSELINPEQFVISRRRKKYKFAKFANAGNCFEFDEWEKQAADVLEIGAGTGLFSVEYARRSPQKQFVALDVKGDRLQKGAYRALEQGIHNVRFVRARADQIGELFASHSLQQVWLNFADPFPRQGSAGRRMTHPRFLNMYRDALCSDGALYIKHDNPAFFEWTLEQLVDNGWHIDELTFNLHESDLLDEYKTLTSYEERWLSEGRVTRFVKTQP